MIERRRYLIGDLSKTNSEVMQAKMKKQIKFVCLVCLSAWVVLSLVVIPHTTLIDRSLAQSISPAEAESKPLSVATSEGQTKGNGGFVGNIKDWLRRTFHRRNRKPVQYYKITEAKGKGNMLPVAGGDEITPSVQNIRLPAANPDADQGDLAIPGINPKFRIHDDEFLKQISQNETGQKHAQSVDWTLENSIGLRLTHFLTNPTTTCRHLVRIGGRSCLGAYDGSKLVCLDNDVRPKTTDCLVYSFGVGNDFSFDNHMQDYGCEVHSFDHDNDHEVYDYRQGPKVYFHKARIGIQNGYFKTCEQSQYGLECEPALRYQTMAGLRRELGHESQPLDYFKMDIEGAEWWVLGDIIHNSTIFSHTKQIALEIHLDDLRFEKTLERKRKSLKKYLDVFHGLQEYGFRVAAYEENELKPKYAEADGVTMSVYAEVLLLKRGR